MKNDINYNTVPGLVLTVIGTYVVHSSNIDIISISHGGMLTYSLISTLIGVFLTAFILTIRYNAKIQVNGLPGILLTPIVFYVIPIYLGSPVLFCTVGLMIWCIVSTWALIMPLILLALPGRGE